MTRAFAGPIQATPPEGAATRQASRSIGPLFRAMHRAPSFLVGCPRTGSSWTAQVLAMAGGVRYVREPVAQGNPPGWRDLRFLYLRGTEADDAFERTWIDVLSWKSLFRKRWLMGLTPGWQQRLTPIPARLLVKTHIVSLALEKLQALFQARLLISVRHPCGYVASSLRLDAKNHKALSLEMLLAQPRLMEDYFPHLREWLEGLDDPVSRHAASYGMVYSVIADQMRRHPDWLLFHHEMLCDDPQAVFRRLCSALDLPYSRDVDRYLARSTACNDGELYGLNRVSKDEPYKWKSELSPAQIDRVAEVVSRFRLPFYREFA